MLWRLVFHNKFDEMSFQVPTSGLVSSAKTGLERAKKITSKKHMGILAHDGPMLGDRTVREQRTPQANSVSAFGQT